MTDLIRNYVYSRILAMRHSLHEKGGALSDGLSGHDRRIRIIYPEYSERTEISAQLTSCQRRREEIVEA